MASQPRRRTLRERAPRARCGVYGDSGPHLVAGNRRNVDDVTAALRLQGLRQEVKPYNIRTTIISPGAVATELPDSVAEPDVAANVRKTYENAIPADSFASAVAFAMSQPEDVDINEILFRPTSQEF